MCEVTPVEVIDRALAAFRAEDETAEAARTGSAGSSRPTPSADDRARRTARGGDNRVNRCRGFLKTLDRSVEGQKGSDRAYQAARVIWNDFNIDFEQGYQLLQEYNLTASPPWPEEGQQGLRRKWDEAVKHGPGPEGRGYRLTQDRPGYPAGRQGGRERPVRALAPGDGGHVDPPAPADTGDGDGELRETAGDPHRLARVFLTRYARDDRCRLVYYGDEWFEWTGGRYVRLEDGVIAAELTAAIRAEFEAVFAEEHAAWRARPDGEEQPNVRHVTRTLLGNVLNAVRSLAIVPTSVSPPCWLAGDPGRCRPEELLPCPNGLLVLPDHVAGRTDALVRPTPLFFNRTALPFRFDPAAVRPTEWLKFLGDVFEGDAESVTTLQEWFGYSITSDTSQQKALLMIGPRRSGKGTICRALKGLVGKGNFAALNLVQLAEPFGLEPLAGKSVAVVEDCRISDRHAADTKIVEQLLTIIGEGDSAVNRKNKAIIDAKLHCRFTLCSNEAPRLKDPSLALPGRLIVLRLFKSFFGKEDPSLYRKRIEPELPGILLWAIEGWKRLSERGHFVQPRSAAALIGVMEALSSPVRKFVEERCAVEKDARVERQELYEAFKDWCKLTEVRLISREVFSKELIAAVSTVGETRPQVRDQLSGSVRRPWCYTGIRLLSDAGDEGENSSPEEDAPGRRTWTDPHEEYGHFGDDD
jgi:putative DNA primase/helicase